MTPILYESDEQQFTSNGLGRLRDCIRCEVTEERNGVYECEFDYPVTGLHYNDILLGRIIAVEHDENQDIQPFDIYAYSRPENGVVTFYAHHVSYRLNGIVSTLSNINNAKAAFNMLSMNAKPNNPFTLDTNVVGNYYLPYSDGTPRSIKTFLGGGEGSILDTYGGEYEFNMGFVTLNPYKPRRWLTCEFIGHVERYAIVAPVITRIIKPLHRTNNKCATAFPIWHTSVV